MTHTAPDALLVDGLVQLCFAVQRVLSVAAARHDVTVAQVRLMGILRDRDPEMVELAAYLGLDKSSITGLIDRAETRGLVRRVPSKQDRRVVHVVSTALGRRLTIRVAAEITTAIGELTSSLTEPETRRLATLSTKVVAAR